MNENRKLPKIVEDRRTAIFATVSKKVSASQARKRLLTRTACVSLLLVVCVGFISLIVKFRSSEVTISKEETNVSEPKTSNLPKTSLVEFDYLSDSELLSLLDDLGHPSSLGTMGDQVIVVSKSRRLPLLQ